MNENIKSIVYGGKGHKAKHHHEATMKVPPVKDIEGTKMAFNEEKAYSSLGNDIKKKAKF